MSQKSQKNQMKPLLKIVNTQSNKTFQIMKVDEPYFFPSWHFHPELEIMLVLAGTGIRFVGDSIERFFPGDLVFYGSNIPHLYRSDKEYYGKNSSQISKAKVVYFKEDFLGSNFWELPDISPIKKLFSLANQGIKFKGETRNKIINYIHNLDDKKGGVERIIDLLTVLKAMAETTEYDLLSSISFTKNIGKNECERMNKVYQFIMDNYAENPSLGEISKIANMSPTAFCRYFKVHTNKTYTQFLNEVKVGNACKLLLDNELSISQICFEIGFNNFPHFNTQFKKFTGLTPKQYKIKHFFPSKNT